MTSELLSLSTGNNPAAIRSLISSLRKDGIITVKSGTGGATLNCPLNEITLYRICKAIEPDFSSKLIGVHSFSSPICPIGKNIHNVLDCSYQKIREDLCKSLKSISLENVVYDYHHIQRNPD